MALSGQKNRARDRQKKPQQHAIEDARQRGEHPLHFHKPLPWCASLAYLTIMCKDVVVAVVEKGLTGRFLPASLPPFSARLVNPRARLSSGVRAPRGGASRRAGAMTAPTCDRSHWRWGTAEWVSSVNGVSKMASPLVRRGDLAMLINLWAPQRLSDGAGSLQRIAVWGLVGLVCLSSKMAKLSQLHTKTLLLVYLIICGGRIRFVSV